MKSNHILNLDPEKGIAHCGVENSKQIVDCFMPNQTDYNARACEKLAARILMAAVEDWIQVVHLNNLNFFEVERFRVSRRELDSFFESGWFDTLARGCGFDPSVILARLDGLNELKSYSIVSAQEYRQKVYEYAPCKNPSCHNLINLTTTLEARGSGLCKRCAARERERRRAMENQQKIPL
jgi:hypothetical protein